MPSKVPLFPIFMISAIYYTYLFQILGWRYCFKRYWFYWNPWKPALPKNLEKRFNEKNNIWWNVDPSTNFGYYVGDFFLGRRNDHNCVWILTKLVQSALPFCNTSWKNHINVSYCIYGSGCVSWQTKGYMPSNAI